MVYEPLYHARHVRVCSKLKTNWKSVVFTNNAGKNSRYFVGVFDKTIIPLALVGYEMIIVNSYSTRTRGIIVKENTMDHNCIIPVIHKVISCNTCKVWLRRRFHGTGRIFDQLFNNFALFTLWTDEPGWIVTFLSGFTTYLRAERYFSKSKMASPLRSYHTSMQPRLSRVQTFRRFWYSHLASQTFQRTGFKQIDLNFGV